MSQITPQSARSLAIWLAMTHADLFNTLFGKAVSKGLGDWTDVVDASSSVPADINIEAPVVSGDVLMSADSSPDNSSSVGAWLSSVGSGVTSAVSSVGNWLTSSQGLNTLANTASAYFKAQGNQAMAQTQQQIFNTQMARAASGQPVAPITYVRNPVTGTVQPAYVTGGLPPSAIAVQQPLMTSASGLNAYPLTPAGLSQITPSGIGQFVSQYGLWIVGGLLGLFLLSRARA